MKVRFKKIKMFGLIATTFFYTCVQAQQCIELFSAATPQAPHYLIFANQIKSATSDLVEKLRSNYKELRSVRSNQDQNTLMLNIVDLNNRALEIFEAILSNQFLFKSVAEKMFQNSLTDEIFSLLRNQGLSREQANAVLNSRVALKDKLSVEMERVSAPIGFLRSTPTKNREPTERTIGFNQNKLQTELYGRNNNQQEKTLDHSRGAEKAPVGFVYAKSNSVSPNRLKSIGFTASEDAIDIAYTLSLGFDYENSTFISVSNRKSMGFSIE